MPCGFQPALGPALKDLGNGGLAFPQGIRSYRSWTATTALLTIRSRGGEHA